MPDRQPDIAGQFCGQTQSHAAHTWQTPVPFGSTATSMPRQCAGATGEVPPGPCWHDSGVTWPGQNHPVRCELLAGHAGAHEAEGRAGGHVVWECAEQRTSPGERTPEADQ